MIPCSLDASQPKPRCHLGRKECFSRNARSLSKALPIKVGDEVIGAAGASGAPGGEKDEACVKAGIDKVADQLK